MRKECANNSLERVLKFAELSELGQRISHKRIPVSVTLELTEKCCFSCIHCARDVKSFSDFDITINKWIEIIDQLAEAGTLELTLTGGEPLMHSGFKTIFEYASKKGFAITLFSNAWMIDSKMLCFLKANRLRQLQVSLYSHEAAIHNRITGVKGSFERTIKAIEGAIKAGIRVRCAIMLTKYNYRGINATIAWLEKRKISFNYDFTLFKSDTELRNITELRLPGFIVSSLDRLMPKNRNPEKKIESCNMCRTQACISSKAEVFPCILFRKSAGSLFEKSFNNIWQSSEMDCFREYNWKNMKKCNSCILRNYCFICPGFNITEGGLWSSPSEEGCRIGLARLGVY